MVYLSRKGFSVMAWVLNGICGQSREEKRNDGTGTFFLTTVFDGVQSVEVASDTPIGEEGKAVSVPCSVRLRARTLRNGQVVHSLGVSLLKPKNNPATANNGAPIPAGASR
jgi:hypothetical protein